MTDPLSAAIRSALAGDPREAALEFHGEAISWDYLRRVVQGLESLLAQAHLPQGAAIGLVPHNRPIFCAALLALLATQRTIVMSYAFQSPAALAADLKKSQLRAVIVAARDWNPEILAALPTATLGIALDSDLRAAEPVALVAGRLDADRSALRPVSAQPMLEMLTSGTTGPPKRHAVSYDTLQRAVIGASVLDGGTKPRSAAGPPGIVSFPLSNISGLYSYLPMAVARRMVLLLEKFNVAEWAGFVRRFRPQVVVCPPAGLRMALDAGVPPADFEGVRYILVGTSAVDPNVHREFEQRYGVSILLSYGATEFCGAATTMTAELHEQFGQVKFGSVGKPQPGNDVRVVDPHSGAALPPGQTGLLTVRIGALGPDYIRTTDLGMLDEDGFLFIKGRADGVISRGGFKILPATVEGALNRYPGVAVSSIVGIPDARLGEVPVAAIEMQPGVSAPDSADLEAHLRAQLPAPHIPVSFRIVEALPRTPSLKVDLRAVRALFQKPT